MTEIPSSVPDPLCAIAMGGAVSAFVPQTAGDAFRLAEAIAQAGRGMIPEIYEGNPGACFLAITKGAELGLAPLAALQYIAPIGGRATVWGDALPGLVQRAGHQLDERVRGKGDAMVATCTLIRSDGTKTTRRFSVEDARRAGLWGLPGPWTQYPKRMLQMRARGFAVRDGAADLIMGLAVAEEVRDYTHPEGGQSALRAGLTLQQKLEAKRAARRAEECIASARDGQKDVASSGQTDESAVALAPPDDTRGAGRGPQAFAEPKASGRAEQP